jgi:hypothetical protein
MSLYATARLEILSAQQGLNKFALKSKLYINAIRQVFDELRRDNYLPPKRTDQFTSDWRISLSPTAD